MKPDMEVREGNKIIEIVISSEQVMHANNQVTVNEWVGPEP